MQNYSFDPDYLREKYRQERDKRLRDDGNDQYQEVSGDFSYFVDDPYINDSIERQALTDSYEIVIIGDSVYDNFKKIRPKCLFAGHPI